MELQELELTDMQQRVVELRRLIADADQEVASLRPQPSSPGAQVREKEHLQTLEGHVEEVEHAMQEIAQRLPPKPRHQRPRAPLPGHLRMPPKKPPPEEFPLHKSPNIIQTVADLERRCEDRLGGERVRMVWAMTFKMPEQNRAEDGDGDGDEIEDEVNEMEEATGYDLDGDGDVGAAGDPYKSSLKLRISHEAWVACERIIESDLVLRHVIPIDQRFLVRGVLPAGLPPYLPQPCATRSAVPSPRRLPRPR